jgi:hypothetical protein
MTSVTCESTSVWLEGAIVDFTSQYNKALETLVSTAIGDMYIAQRYSRNFIFTRVAFHPAIILKVISTSFRCERFTL